MLGGGPIISVAFSPYMYMYCTLTVTKFTRREARLLICQFPPAHGTHTHTHPPTHTLTHQHRHPTHTVHSHTHTPHPHIHTHTQQHDMRTTPANPDGAYIMDPFSTDGSQPNNNQFSLRSRQEMLPVIRERGQNPGTTYIWAFVQF